MRFFPVLWSCLWLLFSSALRAEPHATPAHPGGMPSEVAGPLSPKERALLARLCQRPAETICDLNPADNLAKESAEIRREVEAEALKSLAEARGNRSVNVFEAADDLAALLELIAVPVETVMDSMGNPQLIPGATYYLRKVEEIVGRELGPVQRIPNFLETSIRKGFDEALKAQSFGAGNRERLLDMAKGAIRQVMIFTASEYLAAGGSFRSVRTFCGRRLLAYNSFFFAEEVPGGDARRSVVVCPGLWINAIAAKRTGNFSRHFIKDALLSILSHETGHRIDYKRAVAKFGAQPTPYDAFAACVHSTLPGGPPLEEFKQDDFNEIVADYWSAEVLAALHRTGDLSRSDLIRVLINSSGPYCASSPAPEDPHPPGHLRITLKVRNPRLQSALACPERTSPLCGIEGRAH